MCGVAGLFLPNGIGDQRADLAAMLGVMSHRGPNGSRKFISSDKRYQAGFARLAVIDLETGEQPIIEKNGERVLMCNGEIYNYRELRKQYPNYPYQTHGDIETILPAHTALAGKFVEQLNGMFALALYERKPHRLTLIRDRLGIKPLYWARTTQGGFVFASEIKALFASGLINRALNLDAGSTYLSHGYIPAPQTLFKGVNKLPPGHSLVIDGEGQVVIKQYWKVGPADNVPSSTEQAADNLTALLEESIALQLRSDVPVGALLSSGIDSGLMVALAAKQSTQALKTFTVSFEGARIDEAPLAGLVAERYGTDHTKLTISASNVASKLPELVWHCEEPLFDASLLPNFLIEKALSGSVTVVLNGSGGDELFAGYGRYFQLPVERSYLLAPRWLRHGVIEPLMKTVAPMTSWRLARGEKFNDDPGAYLHEHLTQFPAPCRHMIGNRDPQPKIYQSNHFDSFDGPKQTAMLAADIATYLPEDLLLLLDRSTMAVSVEGRVPYLDHRFVEAALAIPPDFRTPGNQQKALERHMAKPYLPNAILNAPKQGFASPVPAWFKNTTLVDNAKRILGRQAGLERGWWTTEGISALFADPIGNAYRIYALLMLELSIIIHIENKPLPTAPKEGLGVYADAA